MTPTNTHALRELDGAEMQRVGGGLLLPAVQKVREAAARTRAGLLLPAVQNVIDVAARVGDLPGGERG